jgi:RNA polymerase sigma-70 factor (ECF subfamily)
MKRSHGDEEAPMPDLNTFSDFIRRIRAGDEQAAAELVRQYEPLIRREVRLHLEDQRLCRLFDSMDVCQSVLASFFVRTAAGQYGLERPEQMVKLLVTMARNKVVSAARQHQRQRRDIRRTAAGSATLARAVDESPGPGELAAAKELLERLRQSLTTEEKQLADLRSEGMAWADIATRLGGTAQARRMQLVRAIERIGKELGLEEGGDE